MLKNLQQGIAGANKDVTVVPLRPTITPPRKTPADNTGSIRSAEQPLHIDAVDRTLRCRYEMKYFVSESTAQVVKGFVQNFLPLDKYSRQHRNGTYPIVSLYMDSHDLQLCRESLDGRRNRVKLRIRSYTDEPDYPCFFEIKRRLNGVCLKDRTMIDRRHVEAILPYSQRAMPVDGICSDRNALQQFVLYVNSINASPVIKIRYMREAYEDDSYNRVRVTFDRQLAFKAVSAADLLLNGGGWQYHPEAGVVLEIKFTDHYPSWIAQMIQMFNLQRQSFSKYARSVERSCLMHFCAPAVPGQRIVGR